ncbi:MAG TPA: tetratricopeptide repeat protein [Thermoanaerobaculia bacterium]|nr:tetratricopeptide repeat protein [Thermoanaerobaculia bacterium]
MIAFLVTNVDWIPAAAMLSGGLILGLMLARHVFLTGNTSSVVTGGLELRDLEGKREALLVQLREVDDLSDKLTPEQQATERHRLELEAARTLIAIDQLRGIAPLQPTVRPQTATVSVPETSAPVAERVVAPAAAGSSTKGFIWGVGSAAALMALGFFLMSSMKERREGGSVTGNTPGGMQPAPSPQQPAAAPPAEEETPAMKAELQRLKDDVAKNPNDLDAHLELAYGYLTRRQMMGVYDQTQYVLEKKPGQPRALAYQAIVKLSMGDAAAAEQMLKQALATDPNLLEGWIHLALVYTQTNRFDEATSAMKEAMKRHPEESGKLTDILAEIRTQAAASRGQGGAMAESQAPPAMAAPSAGAGAGVSGIIDLDPSARGSVPSGSVIFLIARAAGVAGGPPAAAKRLRAGTFPMDFQLTTADSMMGQPLPANLRLEARVDSDGNPMTKNPSDPSAAIDNLPAGATSVRLVLKK